jgi:hypothetical protein
MEKIKLTMNNYFYYFEIEKKVIKSLDKFGIFFPKWQNFAQSGRSHCLASPCPTNYVVNRDQIEKLGSEKSIKVSVQNKVEKFINQRVCYLAIKNSATVFTARFFFPEVAIGHFNSDSFNPLQ